MGQSATREDLEPTKFVGACGDKARSRTVDVCDQAAATLSAAMRIAPTVRCQLQLPLTLVHDSTASPKTLSGLLVLELGIGEVDPRKVNAE